MSNNKRQITGLILAGGAGRRVGGSDKGLLSYRGRPLIAQVVQRLGPQVGALMICCNRNTADYARYCAHLVHDRRPEYQGPLAGLEAAMNHVSTPYLAIAPCDNPLLPADLVMRLCEPLRANPELDISYAHDGQRPQFLFAVLRTDCLADVSEYLDHEQRSVGFWMQQHKCQQVDFSDRREQLLNFNELEAIAK